MNKRPGFTLIEMLTTVAVLIIVLGLMVSLARYVRGRSAEESTKTRLRQLDALAADYARRTGHMLGADPAEPVSPFLETGVDVPSEAALLIAARKNNEDFVRLLRGDIARPFERPAKRPAGDKSVKTSRPRAVHGTADGSGDESNDSAVLGGQSTDRFGDLPISSYDEVTLRDAWGSPIVFMPQQHPAIGMAPHNPSFFFSAGPDGKYLTRDDNLYSYER
jgi:type II secretory pathway pseudopilin PulG